MDFLSRIASCHLWEQDQSQHQLLLLVLDSKVNWNVFHVGNCAELNWLSYLGGYGSPGPRHNFLATANTINNYLLLVINSTEKIQCYHYALLTARKTVGYFKNKKDNFKIAFAIFPRLLVEYCHYNRTIKLINNFSCICKL